MQCFCRDIFHLIGRMIRFVHLWVELFLESIKNWTNYNEEKLETKNRKWINNFIHFSFRNKWVAKKSMLWTNDLYGVLPTSTFFEMQIYLLIIFRKSRETQNESILCAFFSHFGVTYQRLFQNHKSFTLRENKKKTWFSCAEHNNWTRSNAQKKEMLTFVLRSLSAMMKEFKETD